MNILKAEIITVGTKILTGQIVNTNAQYLSEKLTGLGVECFFHTTVGNNMDRIVEVASIAKRRANLLVFTGGISPMQDAITKEAVAKLLRKSLVKDEVALNEIKANFTKKDSEVSESNLRQALTFSEGKTLTNTQGYAVGSALEDEEGVKYLILPGPPDELRTMFETEALPWLRQLHPSSFHSMTLKFAGIEESLLEKEIRELLPSQEKVAIMPCEEQNEASLRLSVEAKDHEEAMAAFKPIINKISQRLGEHLYAHEDVPIETVVVSNLLKHKWSLSSAESCTGGLFGKVITTVPNSGEIFKGGITCYCNEVKNRLLNVPNKVLEEKGAVSAETAELMAKNVREMMKTTIGASFTGVAGPSESEGKPTGLVYIGLYHENGKSLVKSLKLSGSRNSISEQCVKALLYELYKWTRDAEKW